MFDFFSEFEARDWVTTLISIGALTVSIVAIVLRLRETPRPVIETKTEVRPVYGQHTWVVEVRNAGPATANMLEGWIEYPDGDRREIGFFETNLKAGSSWVRVQVPLVEDEPEEGPIVLGPRPIISGTYRVHLSWREGPNPRKPKTRTLTHVER